MVKGQKAPVRNLGKLKVNTVPDIKTRIRESTRPGVKSVSTSNKEATAAIRNLKDKPKEIPPCPVVNKVNTEKKYILLVFTNNNDIDNWYPIIEGSALPPGFVLHTMSIVNKAEEATQYDTTFSIVDTRGIGLDNEIVAIELAELCDNGIIIILRKPVSCDKNWLIELKDKVLKQKDINNENYRCYISERYNK